MSSPGTILDVPLHEAARARFLNYAVSVITSRALPDVRDGLKPVQRRILYSMAHDLKLWPDKPPLKCAKVVGHVLGSYHPHGDTAVYETLVRLAQEWVLRCPLVDGQGNFGSLDGDAPAAYRYTEARLRPLALEFMAELEQDTVDFRPTFDDTTVEPVVLPARFPQLLVNGCAGIAVGVATNLPPHNLREVLDACLALIKDPNRSDLLSYVKGPDFPTGGELLIAPAQLKQLYEEGQGSLILRGEVVPEESSGRWQRWIITSVPYLVAKSRLVEEIARQIEESAIPGLVNVRDESAEDVRIVLEMQPEAPAKRILQRLYDKTPLQTAFHANFTCLTPEGLPARMGLKALLEAFLDFRKEVVRRRLEHEDRELGEKLHLLEGFMRVFRALDEAVKIIRRAESREESARQLKERFQLDDPQAQAVLELRLYRLGKKDVELTRREHEARSKRRKEVRALLASPQAMLALIAQELSDLRKAFSQDPRRTRIRPPEKRAAESERYLVGVSAAGWICRKGREESLPDRPKDSWQHQLELSSGQNLMLFTSGGAAFTLKVEDLPAEPRPIQKLATLQDEERLVGVLSSAEKRAEAVYVAADGTGCCFSLDLYRPPAPKTGRRFARTDSQVLGVLAVQGSERLILASQRGLAWCGSVELLPRKTGKGVVLMGLGAEDVVLGFAAGHLDVRRVGGSRTLRLSPKKVPDQLLGSPGVPMLVRGRLELADE